MWISHDLLKTAKSADEVRQLMEASRKPQRPSTVWEAESYNYNYWQIGIILIILFSVVFVLSCVTCW